MSEFPRLSDLSPRRRRQVEATQEAIRAVQSHKMGMVASAAEIAVEEAQEPSGDVVQLRLFDPLDFSPDAA